MCIRDSANACVWRWSSGELAGGPEHYVSVRSSSDTFAANRHFFAPIKDLKRPSATPEMNVEATDANRVRVRLQAPPNAYVYFAHLTGPSESTHFSDNYFDLEPGESRELLATDALHAIARGSLSVGSG